MGLLPRDDVCVDVRISSAAGKDLRKKGNRVIEEMASISLKPSARINVIGTSHEDGKVSSSSGSGASRCTDLRWPVANKSGDLSRRYSPRSDVVVASVHSGGRAAIAAISVSGPSTRFARFRLGEVVVQCMAEGNSLSAVLGYRPQREGAA
jgi:hypothetical protein